MFFRILASSFKRSPRRKLVGFGALLIASMAWTVVLAIATGLGDRARRDFTSYGANIVVRPETAEAPPSILGAPLPAPPGVSTLAEDSVLVFPQMFWKHALTGISPVLPVTVGVGGQRTPAEGVDFARSRGAGEETLVTGIRAAHPAWKLTAGAWPRDGEETAAAGWRLAAARGWGVGRRLRLDGVEGVEGIEVALAGVFAAGERADEELLLPLPIAQRLAGRPGLIGRIDVAALTTPEARVFKNRDPKTLSAKEYDQWYCTPFASSIAAQITEAIPGARATPVWRVSAAEERTAEVGKALLLFAGAAAFGAAFLAVFATLYDSVTERAPEIGLWKALGAEPEKVAAVFLTEAGLTGAAGGIAGALAGLAVAPAAAQAIFGVSVARPLPLAATCALAAVAVSLAASLRPVRRALALDPIAALRES